MERMSDEQFKALSKAPASLMTEQERRFACWIAAERAEVKRLQAELQQRIDAPADHLVAQKHAEARAQAAEKEVERLREYSKAMEETLESANECHSAIQDETVADLQAAEALLDEIAGLPDKWQAACGWTTAPHAEAFQQCRADVLAILREHSR